MSEIELRNVSKEFYGDYVFRNLNLQIEKKEMVALVGNSGCGKTTVLNLIGLLDMDYKGEIYIQGKDIQTENKTLYYRYKIGYLFQNFALIDNKTVNENLDIALKYMDIENKQKAKLEVLEKVNLVSKLNKKVFTLSGGEQQRVAIARILLKRCEIVLADEPTGSLDLQNKIFVMNLLKELQEMGKTVIVVTHDKEVSKFCDRVIDLDLMKKQ